MFSFTKNCLIGTYLFSSIALMAVDTGSTSASLDAALTSVNAGPDFNLNFNMSVSLVEQVRAVNSDPTFTYAANTITVTGNNNSLDGGTTTRGFFIGGESSSAVGSVTISNLVFNDCSAQGGSTGQARGGAGMGAGGGLFVGRNTVVILDNCSITNCSAMGGSSGDTGGAITTDTLGGAGMGGNSSTAGSGGGGYGGDADSGGGGSSGFAIGDASGLTPGGNFGGATAPAGAPGIGGSATSPGGAGGFGGGGGASIGFGTDGGIGGFGGGGGGGGVGFGADSADGGFGGGGGTSSSGGGGNGGFGGGGGFGVTFGSPGFGGFGGGNASAATGGAGAGFGGGIFMEPGSDLTILNSITFGGNTTAAGTFGNANTDSIAGFGALGADIFMMSESTLTFDITSGVTLPNPIEGNQGFGDPASDTSLGGLTKRGPARLTLTGANTYTGTTSVEEGELRITSSVVTDVIVSAGAVLSGNFDILEDASAMMNGGNLTNSGTVSPGTNGIGTITLDGSYVQNPSGTFLVDITPDGQADRLFMNTNGTATLSGTLEVVLGAGNYISGTTYTVINAPTLGTEFDTILKTGPDADFVTLQVDYSSVIITVLNNRIFEDQSINSGVPSAVADCFREAVPITPGSDFAMVTELLGLLSVSDVNSALTSLSPVRFGALEWINERNNSYVADLLSQHLFELCCSPRDCCSCDCDSSFWITVFGNIMDNTKRLDNLRRFDANAVGALAGMDFCCGPCFYYGASVGYTHTHLIWRNQGGKGNLDSYYGALYASWHCDCFSADVSAIGGGTDQDLERRIVFTGLDRVAKSDPWGYFVTGHLGLRSKWDWCCTTFEPFGVADYNYYTRQSFKERGADSINLNVRSKDQHFIRGEAGLRVYSDTMSNCYCVAPYIGLSWVGEFPLHASKQKATFINQDCVMDVESYDSSVQLASPQGGVKWTCCNGASLTLGYKGLFNNKTRINQVEGRFEWIF